MPMNENRHDREQDDDAYRENNRQDEKYACNCQIEEKRSNSTPCVVKKAIGDRREGDGLEDELEGFNDSACKNQGHHGYHEHNFKQNFAGHAIPNEIDWQLKQRT